MFHYVQLHVSSLRIVSIVCKGYVLPFFDATSCAGKRLSSTHTVADVRSMDWNEKAAECAQRGKILEHGSPRHGELKTGEEDFKNPFASARKYFVNLGNDTWESCIRRMPSEAKPRTAGRQRASF